MGRRRRSPKGTRTNGPWKSRPGLTERLVDLHNSTAHSARQIAGILSIEFGLTITRSQVIGKAGRLKLSHREISSRPQAKPKPPPSRVRVAVLPPVPVPPPPPLPIIDRSQLRVATLPIVRQDGGLCRFLYDEYPYVCCCEPKQEGSSYCAGHHYRVHVPAAAYVPMRRRL
jgi:hypothetical protein